MKKLKYVFWLIFVGFFVLLVYQNIDFFSEKNSLHIDLGIYQRSTSELTNGAIIAGFVGIGVFIMLLFYLSSRYTTYRAHKIIKELKNALDERTSAFEGLKAELESIKQGVFPTQKISEEAEAPDNKDEAAEAQVAQSPQA